MAVDPVSAISTNNAASSSGASGASSANSATAAAGATINYNDFLKLLIAQMQHQDPTSPMDATAQISQLASFSQVEQQIQTNNHLETVLTNQMLSQAANYVGKDIISADGTVKGTVKEVSVYSDGIIAITDAGGKVLVQPGISVTPAGGSASIATTTTTTNTSTTN
jgi:flagellar basal-body rod modification protein FlgD